MAGIGDLDLDAQIIDDPGLRWDDPDADTTTPPPPAVYLFLQATTARRR